MFGSSFRHAFLISASGVDNMALPVWRSYFEARGREAALSRERQPEQHTH
jgi:hypothetical protein